MIFVVIAISFITVPSAFSQSTPQWNGSPPITTTASTSKQNVLYGYLGNCSVMPTIISGFTFNSAVNQGTDINGYSIQLNMNSLASGLWLQNVIAWQGGTSLWVGQLWQGNTILWSVATTLPDATFGAGDKLEMRFFSVNQTLGLTWIRNGTQKYFANNMQIISGIPRVQPTNFGLLFVGYASGLSTTFTKVDISSTISYSPFISNLNILNWPSQPLQCGSARTGESSNVPESLNTHSQSSFSFLSKIGVTVAITRTCKTFTPSGFGIDNGAVTNCYSPNGTFYFSNSAGDNMSIAPLGITVGGLGLTSLSETVSKNSSSYDYSITGKSGVNNENIDMFVNNDTAYSKRIIVKWSLSIPSAVFTFTINNPNGRNVSSTPTSYCVGAECFDFSDIASIATLVGNTVVVTITNTTGRFDPLTLDGNQGCITSSAQSTCNISGITTANNNDVIYLFMAVEASKIVSTVSCTANCGSPAVSAFTKRQAATTYSTACGANCEIEAWYATWGSKGTPTITVTLTGNAFSTTTGMGISGANTASPFDTHSGFPCTNTGTSTSTTCTITTTNPNDFIIAGSAQFLISVTPCSWTQAAGFTKVRSSVNPACSNAVSQQLGDEEKIVSVAQTNLAVTNTFATGTADWGIIADAIVQQVTVVQTKVCTFTAATSPTCQFASNVPVGDIAVVGVEDSASTIGVTSITDGSNTYTKIIDNSVLTAVGDNTVYCSNVATAGILTVTANLGASASGGIFLYDLNDAATNCATTGSDDSSGQNILSSSPAVSSYTPSTTGLEIGFTNNGCRVACTVTAGNGYTLDNNVGITAGLQASSESIANLGTATTTPFSLSVSSAWNEVSVTFVIAAETTVVQPLTCTTDNSGTQPTLVLSGGNPSPATLLCNGISSNITLDKNTILTETVPSDATNTRDRYSGTLQVRTSAGCASGTCTADTFTVFFQLQNTYQASPTGGMTTWDAVYTIIPTGTLSGVGNTNICTITTASGGGAVSCSGWGDYNRAVSFPSNPTGSGGTSWTAQAPTSFSDTTGGNTDNDNYNIAVLVSCCSLTNTLGLTITYIASGVTTTSTSSSITADTGTTVTVVGIYTCTYTIQNASFINQFASSGIQIWTASAASAVNDFAVGVNHPLLVTFSEVGHVITCIPSTTHLNLQNVYANGITTAYTTSSDSTKIYFIGAATNEIDFIPPSNGQGGNIPGPSITTILSSPALVSAGILPVVLVGILAFVFINDRKKKRSVEYEPPSRSQTGQTWNRSDNNGKSVSRANNNGHGIGRSKNAGKSVERSGSSGQGISRATSSGSGVSRASNSGSSVNRSGNQNGADVSRADNKGRRRKRFW